MKTSLTSALIVTLLAAAAPAHAMPIAELIINGGFEQSVALNRGSWTTVTATTPASDWITGTYGYEVRNNVAGTAQEGDNFVELDTSTNSTISQIVKTTLGQTYNLSFWYAPRAGVAETSNAIEALWNGAVVATVTGNGNLSSIWAEQTVQLAGTGGLDTLTFRGVGLSDSYGGSLDNVSLTAAVPEPGTYALLLAALGLMGTIARRRKAARN